MRIRPRCTCVARQSGGERRASTLEITSQEVDRVARGSIGFVEDLIIAARSAALMPYCGSAKRQRSVLASRKASSIERVLGDIFPELQLPIWRNIAPATC